MSLKKAVIVVKMIELCSCVEKFWFLGFPEHFNHFVDNFRVTAAISLLKYIVQKYDTTKFKYSVELSDGKVPISSLKFAIDRCLEYIASQKHLDIDRDFTRVTQQVKYLHFKFMRNEK